MEITKDKIIFDLKEKTVSLWAGNDFVTHNVDSIDLDGSFITAQKAFPDKNRAHKWMGTVTTVENGVAYSTKDLCYGRVETLNPVRVGY
jgi:hypothetical protein